MSFWLRSKKQKKGAAPSVKKTAGPSKPVIQLDVDVYRESDRLVIFAPMPGADISDVHLSIEGDSDTVVISGRQARPPLPARKGRRSGAYVTEECEWAEFYRRIITPAPVDITKAEAKMQKGVLVVSLPLY